ncbi:alpha/beta hydrolase family protein [Nitrospirillum viridazoti]|uniref:alpha/beta hydrolase family protein n=1 Tax=Nitrospirillum viridazoti TaxID=3144925 RepID=UPI0011ACA979|nr:S9 family peptidase [Nitrospirillum amazonense]TWB40691.1 dipeptidyl aminopeptidase/acylaminoacyl peptidase [Nitrospirillum amazonense]
MASWWGADRGFVGATAIGLVLAVSGAAGVAQAGAAQAASSHQYTGLSLSGDGRHLAAVEADKAEGVGSAGHGTVVVRGADGAVALTLDPCAACRYAGPAWSPDDKVLAFVGTSAGQAILYLAEGGTVRPLAAVQGLASTPRWSPDGTEIALLVTENAKKEAGATHAGARQVGEQGEGDDVQRIAIVTVASGAVRLVSPDKTYVYDYDWMPDGKGFVATAAEGNGDNNWWIASLRAFGRDGTMRVIASSSMQIAFPRVSPDGKTVAFIGGLMSDFGSFGGDVYTVPVKGGEPKDVTAGYAGTLTSLAWRGNRLVAGVTLGGETGSAVVDPAKGTVTEVKTAAATRTAGDGRLALDRAGTHAAWVAEGFDFGPRIEYGHLGDLAAITHDNDGLAPLVTVTSLSWKNDGMTVQGWLVTPRTPVANGAKRPMVVNIHGGPSAAHTPRFVWGDIMAAFAKAGYAVFLPNPRGSFGQGEAFTRANIRDFGGGDLRDIMAGIDAAEAQAPIDDNRLMIFGRSYGGFMSMWAITQTQRFKAAAIGAGLSDWYSYYGQNGIDRWMIPFFGKSAYEDPEIYDRLSPIRYIRNVKTPTLLHVGERDIETPVMQTREYWHALRAMGVETSFIVYADEGHVMQKAENIEDLNRRIIAWFDLHIGGAGTAGGAQQ